LKDSIYEDGRYLDRNPGWHAGDSARKADHIIRMLERNGLSPASVCEIGCGAGEILNQLHARMPGEVSFHGYEISPQAFEMCKGRAKERLSYSMADPFTDEGAYFDLVLAIDVLEHVDDYPGFLRKMKGKGRHKVLQIPLDLSVQEVLRGKPILRKMVDVGHIHFFTKETALRSLADAGCEVVDYFYTAPSVEFPAKSLKSLLARAPRRIMFRLNSDLAARLLGGFSLMVLAR
jgi:trans-aconitate methyltransferase